MPIRHAHAHVHSRAWGHDATRHLVVPGGKPTSPYCSRRAIHTLQVLLVTYSCLVASSRRGGSSAHPTSSSCRYDQLVEWLTADAGTDADGEPHSFDGVLAFDEAHKAKGAAHDQPVGKAVVALQNDLPDARVCYFSATGATEVKDMAYMVRSTRV